MSQLHSIDFDCFSFIDYINDCYSPPSAAGSSPYSLAPSSQGQMISPPPGAGTPQESMYNMSMNGGDSYSSMGANVQSQVSILHKYAFVFNEIIKK